MCRRCFIMKINDKKKRAMMVRLTLSHNVI